MNHNASPEPPGYRLGKRWVQDAPERDQPGDDYRAGRTRGQQDGKRRRPYDEALPAELLEELVEQAARKANIDVLDRSYRFPEWECPEGNYGAGFRAGYRDHFNPERFRAGYAAGYADTNDA